MDWAKVLPVWFKVLSATAEPAEYAKKKSGPRGVIHSFADGMVVHDGHAGQVLGKLTELGLDENTIVMYSTDNGAETSTWPDGGTTMFRGEKNTQWEGG